MSKFQQQKFDRSHLYLNTNELSVYNLIYRPIYSPKIENAATRQFVTSGKQTCLE
jgi:hypothetical protein